MSDIKTDADELSKKFDAKDFYGAADMASTIARIALPVQSLGGVKEDCLSIMNTTTAADFLAGFIYGFTGNDHKAYFETCFKDNQEFENDICEVAYDFSTKDNQMVLQGVKKVLGDMPELKTFTEGCPDAKADFDTTAAWFKYWKAQGEMKVYSTAYKNVVSHMDEIKTEAKQISTDYDAKDYYKVAADVSTIAKLALPVQTLGGVKEDCLALMNTTTAADFLAGFIYGFTGNDHKAYFETCFKDNSGFEADICEVAYDFSTKDNQMVLQGVQKVLADMPELKTFTEGCPDAKADFDTTAAWFKYWKAQGEMKVYSTAYKNVVAHMTEIKADASKISDDYNANDYFKAAADVSSICKIALPVQTDFLQ